jgi:hypothetical protein
MVPAMTRAGIKGHPRLHKSMRGVKHTTTHNGRVQTSHLGVTPTRRMTMRPSCSKGKGS